jgi:peptide chain release factor 1
MNYLEQQIESLNKKIEENQALLSDDTLAPLAQKEIDDLKVQLESLEKAKQGHSSEKEDESGLNPNQVTIEIRSAAGGDEANIFAHDLLRMYIRFATNIGFKVEQIDDLTIKIKGKANQDWNLTVYDTFQKEAGVHRVQRVPETESAGRTHTSTATVAVLPKVDPKAVEMKPEDLDWQFTTAGGPGGQNVNKVNSAVRLTHKPTGIILSVRQERSQVQNREIALEMLRSELWQRQEQERLSKIQSERNEAIGSGDRSEKIKTYNFPQNRLTDHRFNKSWYNLKEIIEGKLEQVIKETSGSNTTVS